MYSFLLAIIEKRRFCMSKLQTLLSFFAFLAENLKSPLCTRARDPRFHVTGI